MAACGLAHPDGMPLIGRVRGHADVWRAFLVDRY